MGTTRGRRARLTIRCLTEDLGEQLPPTEADLGSLDHALMEEVRRLAPSSPESQKRILAIKTPMVYRVRHSNWRGATWVDEEHGVVWLLGAAMRREDSADDAFEYFEDLWKTGRLLPTEDDLVRDRLEETVRFINAVAEEVPGWIEEAWRNPREEVEARLAGRIDVLLYSDQSGGVEELWVAVSKRDATGGFVNDRTMHVIFELFGQAVGSENWEGRADWPTGDLQWVWVARLYVREQA